MSTAARVLLVAAFATLGVTVERLAGQVQESAPTSFPLDEVTVVQLQQWMQDGRYTSRQLTDLYLQRIDAIDRQGPTLRSVIEINPDAQSIADALDRERRATGPR